MIYKLHYFFTAAGINAIGYLLGAYMQAYSDASSAEIGCLLMLMPFSSMICKPIICSMADRSQKHKKYLLCCLYSTIISYSPFLVIPLLGPSVYVDHARICWYVFLISKVLGDISFSGAWSIGDALAINYAKRIGTEFSVYRIFGTISWMAFGLFTGWINESPCLPKYVPGFLVLVLTIFLNAAVIWLWPDEYFRMVRVQTPTTEDKKEESLIKPSAVQMANNMSKSLMPRDQVQAIMKQKVFGLLGCGVKQVDRTSVNQVESQPGDDLKVAHLDREKPETKNVGKLMQLQILALLIRRDPRILFYSSYLIVAGASLSPLSFLTISLSEKCNETGACNYSMLAGYLQASMAIAEGILFFYVAGIREKIGRLNMCCLALTLLSVKWLFYGTYFQEINPHYSIIAEALQGLGFCLTLTIMVDIGYEFSCEVEMLIPELLQRSIISDTDDLEKIKLSLSSTTQALVSGIHDGFGRGLSSLFCGLLLKHISYAKLWLFIGIALMVSMLLCVMVIIVNAICKFEFNLRKKYDKRQIQTEMIKS